MSGESLITVRDIYRYYGDTRAIQGVSFELSRGEVLGLLGPNGAGKSTTMQIIAGVLAPSAGQVLIRGMDMLDRPGAAKTQLGYLPEQPPLYRELTVDEYLCYCAALRGISKAKAKSSMREAKERCGLEGVGRRLIGNLSKGYQQRVGIAQAIIHTPAVVILDEPTAGLDPIQIREIRALIRELGSDHGVILSTHILPEVQTVCDRVQIIHQGRLVLDETIDNLAKGMGERSLRIALRRPPPLASVAAIPGVARVEVLEEDRLRLYHATDVEIAETLVTASVNRDWGLHELVPERRTLEEVFVNLTCGEVSSREQDLHVAGDGA